MEKLQQNKLLDSLTKDLKNQVHKKKGRSGAIKHLTVDRNSFLFVNDMTHIRHKKVPPKVRGSNVDPAVEQAKWNVNMNHIFNPIIQKGGFDDTNKFVDEQLQTAMSNHYDYIVTQMFRAFLKQDDVYKLDKYSKKVEIANFAESCEQAVMTFKRAYKALYKKQLSDYEFQSSFEKNRRKTQAQAKKKILSLDVGDAGNALTKLKGEIGNSNSSDRKQRDKNKDLFRSSSESDSELSHSFSNSSESSSSSDEKEQNPNVSQNLSKSMGALSNINLDSLSSKNKEKPVMKRILKRNKELFDDQIASSKHQIKLAFIQYAFSPAELHEMFKEFHNNFLPSYQITKQEIFTLFEYMCDPKMLGKEKVEEIVLPMIGVTVEKEINVFDQLEGSPSRKKAEDEKKKFDQFQLSNETLKDIWEALVGDDQFVRIQKIMPLMMIFFIVSLISDIDKRANNFIELFNPKTKTSLVSTFKNMGFSQEDLHKPNIKYIQVEQAMTILKSNYPQCLTFNQIQTILHQVKERMDVDSVSKKERKLEAFYKYKDISKNEMDEIKSRMGNIKKQMGMKIKLMMTVNKNDSQGQVLDNQQDELRNQIDQKVANMMQDGKSLRTQVENIKKRDKKDKRYDINDDNIGFGKWLAYNISVQMVSNKIYNLNNRKPQKLQQILDNPTQAYQQNFKFYKEERLWWLAMVLQDPYAKEIVNFNAIVKQTLVKKMNDLMPQNIEATQRKSLQSSGSTYLLRSIKQPFMKKIEPGLNRATTLNFNMLFNQINQNLEKKRKEQDKDVILFSMFDYCQTLHQCLQKNICPWATFSHVEMSVFFFVQNLVHKCESILMEQYENKVLLEYVFDYEDEFKGKAFKASQGTDENMKFGVKHFVKEFQNNQLKEKIINRFRRIYGNDSKQEKRFLELCEDEGGNQEKSITHLKEILYANQSCFETKKDFKNRLFKVKEEEGLLDINLDLGALNSIKLPTDDLINASNFKTLRSQRTIQRKATMTKKKTMDKKQLINEADMVINNIFRNCDDENTYKKDSEIFGQEFGENIFSKKTNKYFFQLLQIFGFKDESLISFIDKDRLKAHYYNSKLNGYYPEDDFFECFSLISSIDNLAKFRDKRLTNVQKFRQTMLSTKPDIVWNSYFAQAELDKDQLNYKKAAKNINVQESDEKTPNESLYDIFNYSHDILMKHFLRYQYRSGLNMLLNCPLDKERLEMHEKQFEVPITQAGIEEISDQINMIIGEIELKQNRLNTAKLDKKSAKADPTAEDEGLTFNERMDLFKVIQTELNTQQYDKPKNQLNERGDDDDDHQNRKDSVLNVFLTSQYYGGVFDDNIKTEKDEQDALEAETRLEKEKRMKLQIKMEAMKYEQEDEGGQESGRLKRFTQGKTKKQIKEAEELQYKVEVLSQLGENHGHGHGHNHGDEHENMVDDNEHEKLHNVISLKSSAGQNKKIFKLMEQHMLRKAKFDREVQEQLGESEAQHHQRHQKRHQMQDKQKMNQKVKFEDYKRKQVTKNVMTNPGEINIQRQNQQRENTFVQQVKYHYKNEMAKDNTNEINFGILNSSGSSQSWNSHEEEEEREDKLKKYDPQESIFQAALIQKKKIRNQILAGNVGYLQNNLDHQTDFQAMNRSHFQRTAKYRPNLSVMLSKSNNKHRFRHEAGPNEYDESISRLDSLDEQEESQQTGSYNDHIPSSSRELDGALIYNFTDSGRGSDDKQFFNEFMGPSYMQETKKYEQTGTLFGSTTWNNTQKFDTKSKSQQKKKRRGNKSLATTQKMNIQSSSELSRSFTQSNQQPQSISNSMIHRRRVSYNPRKWLQDGEQSLIMPTPKSNHSVIINKTPKLTPEAPEKQSQPEVKTVVFLPQSSPSKPSSQTQSPKEKRKVLEIFKPVEEEEDFPQFQVTLDEKQKNADKHKSCGGDEDTCNIF